MIINPIAGMIALVGLGLQAGEVDALAVSRNIQARHTPFGALIDPVFTAPESEEITSYTRCGDSALWTGHYLAAESFRYKVTGSAEALDNIRRTFAALKGLVDVTGDNLLARCMVLKDSPYAASIRNEEAAHGIYTNAEWIWVGNTSRDQYSGVIFGLGVAYDMVNDAALKASISELVTRLVDYLRGHNWSVVMPDGETSTVFLARPDQMLTFLQVARHVNPDRFSTTYDIQRVLLANAMIAPLAVDVAGDESYFKFNLDYINLYSLIRLESSSFSGVYEKGYDILRNHTSGHQNAFFNVIDLALNGPNPQRDNETLHLLEGWLLRQKRDRIVVLNDRVAVCGDYACNPIPIELRTPTDFIWQRNPFQLAGGLYGTIEGAGVDYILPYWMARHYGLQAAFEVQSAASANITASAPESIATIRGANVSGDITVTCTDAAGTSRDARLIDASLSQIDIIIPSATAPGVATLTISGGGTLVAAPARIWTVVPALFTADGSGNGVAFGTVTRGGSSVPVYQCDGSGCYFVPIELVEPVLLTLHATGLRNRGSLDSIVVTINGVRVPVQDVVSKEGGPGMELVIVELAPGWRGTGEASIVVTVDEQKSNAVSVYFS
ncbi:MAG TPA: hypothetical protein VM120_09095 [Bryobacteraceae bacterium]|nr:hypothetical protein [Bryobacteraceae bacterium]